MATKEETFNHISPPEMELDEASIVSSLARLHELHISVRCLPTSLDDLAHV